MQKTRIEYLDGHRGVAILMVVLFHAYARWSGVVPYGSSYADLVIVKYGWLGVNLFFMISGFVILMTLEKCSSAGEFLYRRWLRLFPGMLLCSTLILLTSGYFTERPAGEVLWKNFLPGLTFTEPLWWRQLFHTKVFSLEAAFWSLYVEAKFYIFAAVIYFWRGRTVLIGALMLAFLAALLSRVASDSLGLPHLSAINNIFDNLSFKHFGWFAAGASFYVYAAGRNVAWFAGGLAAALVNSLDRGMLKWEPTMAAICVSLFFAASIRSAVLQRVLRWRPLLFFGFVSYPLYLIHENIMISTIIKLGHTKNDVIPMYLYPLVPISLLAAAAYVLAKYGEPHARNWIAQTIGRLFNKRTVRSRV